MQCKFRTPVQLTRLLPPRWQLKPQDKILSLGSCFAANMGHQLAAHKFDVCINPPGGILFNPISIARILRMALHLEGPNSFRPQAQHLPFWHHFDLHSDMNRSSRVEAEANLGKRLDELKQRLSHLDLLILTFGTARVYTYDGNVVANCHKYPHHVFERRLLSLEELHKMWQPLHKALLCERPNLQILLTVSPVRHTRDGLSENGVSKALLRVFCDEWVQQSQQMNGEGTRNVHYFPAYELMMDDLRDYRFYEADMVHPNETAQQYIWEAFQQTVMDESSRKQVATWTQLLKDMNHRPRYPGCPSHVQFLESIQARLRKEPTYIDTSKEQTQIEGLLQSF